MANLEHLSILEGGVAAWNRWRDKNPELEPDLFAAELAGKDFCRAKLHNTNLSESNLAESNFTDATLRDANLFAANLNKANLTRANMTAAKLGWAKMDGCTLLAANLSGAQMVEASLVKANLGNAKLVGADLRSVNLRYAHLVEANLENANLSHCSTYGITASNLNLNGAIQQDLQITRDDEPTITVDDLHLAQFVYLLLNDRSTRKFIDIVTSKIVLIVGSFSPERTAILDVIRNELRQRNYLPVAFDFDKPATRTTLEVMQALAQMSRFMIADLTGAKSLLQELRQLVPNRPSMPVQAIIEQDQAEPGMIDFFRRYHSFLELFPFNSPAELLSNLAEQVIEPAEHKWRELVAAGTRNT